MLPFAMAKNWLDLTPEEHLELAKETPSDVLESGDSEALKKWLSKKTGIPVDEMPECPDR